VNKCAIAIILLSYPSLAIAHGPVGELIGVFLVLFLLQIAGVCLAILLGWRFSVLIHIVVTAFVVPLYVALLFWVLSFLEGVGLIIADTIIIDVLFYLSFYFFTLVIPFIVSCKISRSILPPPKQPPTRILP
jgi:hypothetical protein